jgi:hypothetical protein
MEDKKYNYIYVTRCIISDTFYVGMHSTNNLEDGYLGSGKRLHNSINKYGKENHTIEILEHFKNRKDVSIREKELVNENLLKDPKCMNIVLGGDGGYNLKAVEINKLKKGKKYEQIFKTAEMVEHRKKIARDNYSKSIEKYNFKNIDKDKHSEIAKAGAISRLTSGYVHSDNTKLKIKESNKNKDWSFRKSEEYRKMISDKTKNAMSRLDNTELQRKALEGRLKYWENKREVQRKQIIELQQLNCNQKQIRETLNMSYHIYNSRLKEIKYRRQWLYKN